MKIYLNGKQIEVEARTINDLIVDPQGVAVALNEELITREKWAKSLQENDRVEVVHAVFGG